MEYSTFKRFSAGACMHVDSCSWIRIQNVLHNSELCWGQQKWM